MSHRVGFDRGCSSRRRTGATIAVTGAAGSVGGYAVQLARHAGLRVLADTAPADADLISGWGAEVVPRGPAVAAHFRALAGDGVDAVIDAAVIGPALLPCLRPGGTIMQLRGGEGQAAFDRAAAARGVTRRAFIGSWMPAAY
ncbi:zinc-binding dehydrogenase [Actinoplanes sp. NPDC051513]|uniref:zinc-binding dehydrogenase n=1 Tax=Actinoplanes sp. NPDC051513 TaxID=3363908 RepID=UPI0037BB5C1D